MWVVPTYANPSGSIVSQEVAERLASMTTAAPDFKILWDNAYAFHHLTEAEAKSADILSLASAAGHPHRPVMFASTSKITYAGAGVAFLAGSVETVKWYAGHLGKGAIGPDKLNQLRHAQFFGSAAGRARPHGEAPRDHRAEVRVGAATCSTSELGGLGIATWTEPTRRLLHQPRRARRHRRPGDRAGQGAGVALTPAGSSFPYGRRPARPQHPAGADLPAARRGRAGDPGGRDLRPAGRGGEAGWLSEPAPAPQSCPKAHLHLHFTGSMRHATLLELAERDGIRLPDQLVSEWPPQLSRGRREGLVPLPAALRRGPVGAAHRGRRTPAGARGRRGRRPRRRPLAGDPGRPERVRRPLRRDHRLHRPGPRRGGRGRAAQTGLGDGGRDRRQPHPAPARRRARWPGWPRSTPAAAWSASGSPTTSGAARPPTSRAPSRSPSGPGCGWSRTAASCAGPSTSRTCLDALHAAAARPRRPRRRGPRAARSGSSTSGVALEVCPVSNVALGVYSDLTSVPLPTLLEAGATVALGADDPLLFGSRLRGPVRHDAGRPRPHRRPARRAGPDVGPRLPAPDDVRPRLLAGDRRLAGAMITT